MSDVDNEKFSSLVEDVNEESFPKFTTTSSRKKHPVELRHPRQKYCERWEEEFHWLRADKVDESLGICIICDKQLVCKKSHLERHQNSFRHQRIAGFEVVTYTSDNKNAEYLDNDNVKKEYEQFEYDQTESDELSSEILHNSKKRFKIESNENEHTTVIEKHRLGKSVNQTIPKEQKAKLNRLKLLKRIDNDRSKLNEYYYSRLKHISPNVTHSVVAQPQRDTFDLFFESVSASVKTLPPKLAYEIKSKISQLLTEFELRALCEKEALEQATRETNTATVTPVIVAPAFDDTPKPITTAIDTSTVPHLVYTFPPKP